MPISFHSFLKPALKASCHSAVITLLLLAILPVNTVSAQQKNNHAAGIAFIKNSRGNEDVFGTGHSFIKNIGQYGKTMKGYEQMGAIQYGYEGLSMPVLFTSKGLIHLQRKIEGLSHREEERLEKQGVPEEEIENRKNVYDRVITMEWIGSNPDLQFIAEDKTTDYHTYGLLQDKAYGYKRITGKNLYPGIDIVYSFTNNKKAGFEYSLLVQPGADLNAVKLQYGGDVTGIKTNNKGELIIKSDIDGISTSIPVSYYGDKVINRNTGDFKASFAVEENTIRFSLPANYDHTKLLVIDPFVTGTGNLTGLNAGKAKDVDFDYDGNVYVTGGGNSTVHQLAKYNATGVLQWTFSGTLAIPVWSFGSYWGGWMVEKPTGNIYLGQGFNPSTGFQVIRVSTTGLYDNFITNANANFREAWKMLWSCNNGSPQILVAGGGTNSNINFGVFTPPSTAIGSLNVTNIPYTVSAGWAQDIVDFIIDPANNDMYTIYGSLFGNPSLTNKIYKNTAPYSGASVAWNVPSGFTSVQEIANRPYLLGGQIDNSANIFAINASYLYYWDGKNLKAFDKATGNGVGTPLVTANTTLMQGGIIADACNNIFVGDGNGVIKVYKFNGSTFDDAGAPDITIPGFAGRSVYDLAYDESKKLLYASGDGFVGSFDVSAYCPTSQYTLNVVPDCLTASATVTVSPTPPAGSTVTYALFIGTTQVATNTTGVFTGLSPNITYTVVATINLSCSGTQATITFVMPGPTIAVTQTNTTCGNATGTITATASGTTAPYTYNINGGAFQSSGTFTGLAAAVYTIIAKDANGCQNSTVVTILNSNGPAMTFVQSNADCGSNNGTVTATVTGGTAPYQYSINGGTTYQANNFFTGLLGGTYTLMVKDATGCTNAAIVTITSSPSPAINAIPATATCGSSNGSITAFGSGGTAPLQYSVNGNTFQASNVFTNLTPGTYTVTVKDANGCIKTTTVTIGNSPAPTVTATSTPAACNNINGTVTATATGGIAPLQYSIDGVNFSVSNIFTGLAPGTYTVTVKDNAGCTNIVVVTVGTTNGPTASATAAVSACNTNTGSITAGATGGVAPYLFSIDAVNFQVSNIFNGLGAGTYVVYVKDAQGCIGTISIVVANTAPPVMSVVVTPASCNASDGVITITGSGGTPPYQYSKDGVTFQASNVFTGLASSTIYTITIKDANGCTSSRNVPVTNVAGLSLTVSTIISSCSINNGVITATGAGGAAPLQYSINGTTYQASNVFNGLGVGNYTVFVKDANGCIVSKPATIASVAGPTLSVAIQQNATCGTASGVIIATAAGGLAPLSYNIDGGAFQSIGIFINVAPGVHTITVKDATGCSAPSQIVTITNSGAGTAPTDVTFVVRDVLACTGEGRIKNLKGVPGGGGNNYTFSLDNGPFTAANQFRPVSIGTHTITAKNQNGCTVTRLATIGTGVPATATATATATACGTSNGTITVVGVGANTPYHVSINTTAGPWITFFPPGANSTTFTGLAPGSYTIYIADDADFTTGPPDIPGACISYINVVVPSTGGPSISTTQVLPSCTSNNGNITATGSGGTAPYTYNINGGPFFASGGFNNLTPGVYAVTVKDATGCVNGVTITLPNPTAPVVTATVQSTSCNQNNGIITTTATGGVSPLQYSINGTTFQSSNVFSNLAPGTYTVYVADANQCYGTILVTINNTALPKVTAFTIAATCNNNDGSIIAAGTLGEAPYTFSIDGTVFQSSSTFNGLAAGFYTVYIKDARGCITTTGVTVANTTGPMIAASTTSATCGNPNGSITITATGGVPPYQYSKDGFTFQAGNIFTGLLPGTYSIAVKDANGCVSAAAAEVVNIPGPQTPTVSVVHAACGLNNGSITATATGGTAPLQYSIDGISYQSSNLFSNVLAGSYTLFVKDANGCIATLPVTVLNLAGPTLNASASPASCGLSDGTITALATGGTGVLTYSKDGTTFQASNIFLGLAAGPYTITVKDARGCTSTTTATVNILGASVTPTFAPVGPICSGTLIAPLPTTSLNGITGTWSPAINNILTTTYMFTPGIGQCANTTTLTIVVNLNITPTFNPVAAICSGATLTALPTTSLNGITGTWSPALINTATTTYTFTPGVGQCATTTTLTITVNPNVIPTFNSVAAICSGATLAALPTTSLNGISGTWSPALNNAATTTYTFTPTAGQCATTATLTITVNPNITPTFNPVAAICSGATLTALPTTSLNGITGTWSPALNNTATTTYTFTPGVGQCATTTTLTIVVNPNVTPTFNPVPAICSGGTLTALPTTSLNGITGTWSPALDNTATTTYTFTPTAGQCATTASLTIVVNPNIVPTFNPVAAICSGATISALPTTSLNGITGSWSPALNNTVTATYTFTPAAGQCATITTLTIVVNPNITPTFNPIAAICSGATLTALPTTSINGITGTWSPALNNIATTTYTFTPAAGQCATSTTLTIVVNPIVNPTVNCGVSTTSSVSFTWASVAGATGYTISYQVNGGAIVNPGSIGNVLNYTVTGLTGGDNVSITVTPTGGAGACFASSIATCTATPCTPPTASISYASPFCGSDLNPQPVTLTGTGLFSGGVYAAIAGLTINSTTGAIVPSTSTPGTYIVTYTIAASGGCPGAIATTSVTINPFIVPGFNPITPVCTGALLTALPTTSNNGITGTWSPALDNTITTTYTFTPNAGQCAATTTLTITVNALPAAPLVNIIQPTCSLPTGTITITSPIAGLTFTLDGAPYNSYPVGGYTGLSAGTHTLGAQNASGCISVTTSATINAAPNPPASINTTTTDATCGNANGSLTLGSVTGGTGPYTYSVDGSAFTTTLIYLNLVAESHPVIVKDANGCILTISVTINNSNGANISAVSTPSSCGSSNGSITATGTGGTAPYQFSIDGTTFQISNIFNGLAAGAYTVTIKDANNCTNTTTVTISSSNGATVTAVATPASCAASNGSITATGTGGTAPYQYSINGTIFQSSNIFTSLAAGTYTVTIKDANNCTNTTTVTISSSNGATVTAVATPASCGASNGSITATGNAGTAPYQYSINGTIFQTSNIFTGIAAGAYTVTIKDANNCTNTTTVTIISSNGATVSAISTPASCGTSNGSITATGTGGAAPYQFSINGTTFQSNNIFTGLAAGAYTVTIKDANGCTNTTNVSIANISGATVTGIATDATCSSSNGTITATGAGGTTPYRYSIDGTNFQPANIFTGLAGGQYILTIKDANGCLDSQLITINVSNPIVLNAGNDLSICPGTAVQLSASTNAAVYSWSPSAGLSNTNTLNPIASPAVTTAYILTASISQCIKTDTVIVTVLSSPVPFAGNDASICLGNTVQLHGSGGVKYLWSPATGLSNAANANPVFVPSRPGTYAFALSVSDASGCTSLQKDTVVITVTPPVKVFAGNDTAVAVNQPLQLNAVDIGNVGISTYTWSPSFGLNDAFIQNPVFESGSINTYTYTVTATTAGGCTAKDVITIKVFIKPELYAPNAFTPNGDGQNDVFKLIPVGIKELKYFNIYNRFGEMIFTTRNLGSGWDGTYKGQKQDPNTFVWVAEAVDYNGNVLKRQGFVILIR